MCIHDLGVQVHADLHPGNILVHLRSSALLRYYATCVCQETNVLRTPGMP